MMPFVSDKQRRFLYSQKPEVAKKFAQHKQEGGGVYDLYDDSAKWWNKRMAGVPQHRGYADDPDDITEAIGQNPDDPYTMANPNAINPNVKRPDHYVDMATYYTPGSRSMGRGAIQREMMRQKNAELREEAKKKGFKFNAGGDVPMMDGRKPNKVTQKDRYGNQMTYEFAPEVKPLDQTALVKAAMEMVYENTGSVPPMAMGIGADHPGEPMGSDTVPAWLTPGEYVVNAEAMADPQNAAVVEQINNEGRMMQAAQGGSIPRYAAGGGDAMDFAGPESLTDEQIAARMAAMRQSNPADTPVPMPMAPPWAGRPEGYSDLLHEREGFRDDVYLDTLNKPTVGYGHLLPAEYAQRVGERPFSQQQLDTWFDEDSARGVKDARKNVGRKTWSRLNEEQKAALSSMAFQLGGEGQSKFKKMLQAVRDGDNAAVRREARDSKWFEQTPARVADIEAAFRAMGGPIYAYRGQEVAIQDAMDIEDPMADLSGSWQPPVVEDTGQWDEGDAALMENYEMLEPESESAYQQRLAQQIAMAENMVAGGDGDDLGTVGGVPEVEETPWWGDVVDWTFDTSVADKRNASFNEKATAANAEAAAEALAEMEEKQAAGEPVNPHTMDMARDAVKHTQEQHEEAIIQKAKTATSDEIDAEGVVAAEAQLMAEQGVGQVPGKEDDQVRLEDLANGPEFEEEDNPSKPSEKGQQNQVEVETAGQEKAKQDPGALKKAEGFFREAFNDLFDGKEMARMAIMYLGSRALGYSHGGSLNWAAKQYVGRLDAKQAGIQKNAAAFAKSGKFTPASVAAYQKTGDLGSLMAIKENPTTTGQTMERTVGGKKVSFQQIKMADGSIRYTDPSGASYTAAQLENATAPYEAAFAKGTPEYRTRRSRATGDAAGRFEEVWKAEDRFRVGDNQWETTTNIRPKQAADEFWAWSESVGLDPESDEALQIMTNAYQSAIADGKTSGPVKPNKLRPYLEAEHIRESTGTKELFMTNRDAVDAGKASPTFVRGDKMALLNRNVDYIANSTGHDKKTVYRIGISEWSKLDPEDQKLWNSKAAKGETGFYKFMDAKLAELADKL